MHQYKIFIFLFLTYFTEEWDREAGRSKVQKGGNMSGVPMTDSY